MIMADVFAAFGTMLALGIAFPGFLLTWRLLFPKVVDRARQRLEQTPWRTFFTGAVTLFLAAIPVAIFFNLPWGGAQAIGFLSLFVLLTIASLGAAALAELLGGRLQSLGASVSPVGATVRGAVALELAAIFPLIGWFVVIPLTLISAFGAALFALVGWAPRPIDQPAQTAPSIEDVPADVLASA